MQIVIIFIVAFLGVCIAVKPLALKASGKVRQNFETSVLNNIANDENKTEEFEELVSEHRQKLSENGISQIVLSKSNFENNNTKITTMGLLNIFLLTKIVNRRGKIVKTKAHRYILPIFLNPSKANMRDGVVLNSSCDIPVGEHTTAILTAYSKPHFGSEKDDCLSVGTSFLIETVLGQQKYVIEQIGIVKLADIDGSFIEHRENTIIILIREQGYKSCKICYCVKADEEEITEETYEETENLIE